MVPAQTVSFVAATVTDGVTGYNIIRVTTLLVTLAVVTQALLIMVHCITSPEPGEYINGLAELA